MTTSRRRLTAMLIAVVGVAVLVVAGVLIAISVADDPTPGSPDGEPVEYGFLLDRADPAVGGTDSILRFGSAGAATSIVHEAERIVEFVADDDTLVVVTGTAEDHSVTIVDSSTDTASTLELPGAGTVDDIEAEGGRVGFLFTSAGDPAARAYARALAWFDRGEVQASIVEFDGAPLETAAWTWLPGSGELLAIGNDEELRRFDPAAPGEVEFLGEWEGLEGVSSDGAMAIVRDHHDTVELTLADGTAEPFGPTPIDGTPPFGGDVAFLGEGPERVQKVGLVDESTGLVTSMVVLDDGESPRILYRAAAGEGLDSFEVSPDGRLVAVEVVPDVSTMVSDAYYPHARAVSIVTRIVTVADGAVVHELPGFGVQWGR